MTAAKRPAPISSHPAFKWGVGAWFALLLGLGLFVMPAAVHLLIAERLGIADVFSEAGAIRAVLSVGAALLGLVIGLALAMRVIALNDAGNADEDETEADDLSAIWLEDDDEDEDDFDVPAQFDEGPRRPFNPREDIAEEGIAPFTEVEEVPETDLSIDYGLIDEHSEDILEDHVEPLPANPFIADTWEEVHAAADNDEDLPDEQVVGVDEDAEVVASEIADLEPAEEPVAGAPEHEIPPRALGDMSLDELTQRLGSALEASKAEPAGSKVEETDPVIAFLRREAEREAPPRGRVRGSDDPQAELRSALDKLSSVGKPK